jgi:hypothetical protein
MTQQPLFKDLLAERLAAIGADVDAAGGEKAVGSKLWKSLTPETAGRKMSNALNPKQKHSFTDDEVWQIKQMARTSVGRSRIVEFECGALKADIHWITPAEQAERSERRLEDLLHQVATELQEMKAARAAK